MALPKYKTSRPNCGAPALPHMACPSCGNYRGRTYRSAIQPAHTK